MPTLFIIVMSFFFTKGENNVKSNIRVASFPFNRNTITLYMCNGVEMVVEKLMREEPMTGIDFLILIGLFSFVIYLFRDIRGKK